MIPDLRPRQYAAAIVALEERRQAAALEAVPRQWRAWVEYYVREWHRQTQGRQHGKRAF